MQVAPSSGSLGEPPPARAVGDYEIIRSIGRGGIAVVYLARQVSLERSVALKELGRFQLGSRDMAQRFLRESRIAGSLNHPNIATVFEYFEHDGVPYIAMEYLPRGSLRPYVGRLSLPQFAGVMEGVLAGLAHAETLGIVHRDLKPENLLVTEEGRVKITDFGIAKATQSRATGAFLTTTGSTVGTPTYMAPEQAMAQPVGAWTDLYSVGVMAWEHMVGRVPFHEADAPMVVLMRHINDRIPRAVDVKPGTDPEISDWIDRMLIKDPAERTRSPAAAWDQLEEIVIRRLGPRWRKHARLLSTSQVVDTPVPLTSAPFDSREGMTLPPSDLGALATLPPHAATKSDAEPRWRPSGAWRAVLAPAALAIVAAICAFSGTLLVGSTPTAGGRDRILASGPFEFGLPSDWQRRSAPSLPHLRLAHEIAVGPRNALRALLAIGSARSTDPTLLPASLLTALPRPPAGRVVKLGHTEAYRYLSLAPAGASGSETVYAFSTSTGTVLAVCASPDGASSLAGVCETVLSRLRLTEDRFLAPGPRKPYAAALRNAIRGLNAATHAGAAELAHARTPQGQAKAARHLARAYAQAATRIAKLDPGSAAALASGGLTEALRTFADGYDHLAQAAAAHDRRGYDRARRSVATAGERLRVSSGQVTRFGYDLRVRQP